MDQKEYQIWQTAKAQGKDDAFIKGAIQAYRARKTSAPVTPEVPPEPTIQHGGVSLLARGKNLAGNLISKVQQPFVSLAAVPLQAGAKALGIEDPFAQGVPGLGNERISVTPLTAKQKAGDVLKAGATIGAVGTAPATLAGAVGTGAAIGFAEGAGGALQENAPAAEIIKRGGIGGLIGAAFGGVVSAAGKLIGKVGDKITTSVIRPTKIDIEDGFSLDTVKKYNLGGSIKKIHDKTQEQLNTLSTQLSQKLSQSDQTIDLDDVVKQTIKELTDESKLKGFGANAKVQSVLESLRNEVGIVGNRLSIPDAQVVKQSAGSFGAWQYGKPDPDAKAAEIVYTTFYTKLKKAIEQNSPEGVREINQELSKLIPVMNAVIRRLPVAERNNLISLTDMIGLVSSSMNPVALGPTLLNILSKSGTAANAMSKAGPAINRAAVPTAGAASAIYEREVRE